MDPVLSAVMEAVNRAGAGIAIFTTVLWWMERAERRALQDKRDELLTRTLEAISALRALVTGRPTNGQP